MPVIYDASIFFIQLRIDGGMRILRLYVKCVDALNSLFLLLDTFTVLQSSHLLKTCVTK